MIRNTVDLLKDHGINPSSQRVRIYDYLATSEDHPTVDDIYAHLQREGHLFSRATVYNTVKLFLKKGLIRTVRVEEKEMRFDAAPGFHAHFKCGNCGAILDIETERPRLKGHPDYEVHETSLVFEGLCPDCLEKEAD